MHEARERRPRDRRGDEKLLRLPVPGKRSLVDKVYGPGAQPTPAFDPESIAVLEEVLAASDHPAAPEVRGQLEHALGVSFTSGQADEAAPAEPQQPRRMARGTGPVPVAAAPAAESVPFLPAEVTQAVEAKQAVKPNRYVQAAHDRTPAPEPESGEVVAHRAPRRAAAAERDDTLYVAGLMEMPPAQPKEADGEVKAVRAERHRPVGQEPKRGQEAKRGQEPNRGEGKPRPAPGQAAAGEDPMHRVLADFDEGEELVEEEEELEVEEDLEGLDDEALDDIAADLDLELPPDATVEQKRKAIEAARAARQGKALKGVAKRAKKVAGQAAEEEEAIERQGKAKAAGRAAQGKAATGAAKAAGAARKFTKAKNLDELKARLRKVMDEDKKKFDDQLKKAEDELKQKMKGERQKLEDELKALDQKLIAEIATKEKEIAAQIQRKLEEAKARAETDRKQAQATCESEKKLRREQAAGDARRIESEAAGRAAQARAEGNPDEASRIQAGAQQSAAAARSKGEAAAEELDGKLAVSLDKIASAEKEGAVKLEQDKAQMIAEAQAKAKSAREEGKSKADAALVKINEQERTGLEKLKQANDAIRKAAIEKFEAQMKKLESGKAEDLAKLEAETNKVIAEIDTEVLRFDAVAQAVTRQAVQEAAKQAKTAIAGIQAEGKKASESIDKLAKEAMARVDQHAAEAAAKQAQVADESQRRLTAATPEEAAAVERDAEAREKAEADKVKAIADAEQAEKEKIKTAAAEIAEELDGFTTDEEAILNHLRGKTPEQIAKIKEAYYLKTGKSLDAELENGALDQTELKEAKAHMSGDPVQQAVATLQNAEDGWTGEEDEQRIKETLAKLDPETRKKVAAEYEKQTGRRLNHMLADELEEEDLKEAYVNEDPKVKKKFEGADAKVNPVAVEAAVAKLHGATVDDDLGTNEEAVVEALKGKTPAEIEEIKKVWLDKHGPPGLDAVLEDEMEGTELKEAKAMMSDDPVQKAVASLQDASDGLGTDKAKLQSTLESIKDPVLRAQVAAEFEKQTGEKLDTVLVDELSGRDLDKAQAAAAGDEAGLRAIKFDEAKNSSIIGDFAASAADVLAEVGIDVDPETIATIVDVAVMAAIVVTGPAGLLLGGLLLADEHIDIRDNENAMYAALEECKTPEERKAMEEAFNRRYAPKTLRGEISTLNGAEVDVATALLDGDKAKARAAKMKAGSEQHLWADKDLMFQALQECESKEERDALIAEFNKRYGAAAGGKDYEAMLNETFEPGSLDREKAKQLTEDGKMDNAFAYYYAMKAGWMGTSWGTDTAEMKRILARMSAEDIKKLNDDLKIVGTKYGDPDIDIHEATSDETSGRDGKELEMLLRGAPTTMDEALKRQREMAQFERDDVGGWAIDVVALALAGPIYAPLWIAARLAGLDTKDVAQGAVDTWSDSGEELAASQARLTAAAAEIDRTMKRNPGESQADFEKRKLEAFQLAAAKEEGYLKNYQEHKDQTAEMASTAVGLVVTATISIASGGSAAVAAAAIGGLMGLGAKIGIAGGSLSNEEIAQDLLRVAAEAAAAGVAQAFQLDKAIKGLKALGPGENLIAKVLKEALEEVIENGTSELILALFDPNNYKSPEAFLLGVGGAVGQAMLSGAVAAAFMVSLGELFVKVFGEVDDKKLKGFLKGAFSESLGGVAASAVDPATWEGDMEEVLTRFGKGLIDNILSAGAEGIGEAVGHAINAGKVKATKDHLASQGVNNTKVAGGHVVDLDSGRVFDGQSGEEIGRIHVDPNTGMVTDVTDPSNPVVIGVNEGLKGHKVGGVDTNAQASGTPGNSEGEVDVEIDDDPTVEDDSELQDRPTIVEQPGPTQGEIDQATASTQALDRERVEALAVEKAKAVLATMAGDPRPGHSLEVATAIAAELARVGVSTELHSDGDHHHLRIGDTIIDGSLHQFFNLPDGFSPGVFVGSQEQLRALLAALASNFGLRSDLTGELAADQLFDSKWGSGAESTGMVLDLQAGQFKDASTEAPSAARDPAQVASDFPVLAAASSLNPEVGFGSHQEARAQAALAGMSDAEYTKMRSLVAAQQSDTARAYLLKALAAGNSIGEIERFAAKIHGQTEGWLIGNLSLADPLGVADGGFAQQFRDSCNAAMLIALMGDLDPILALRAREHPDTIQLLARLERQMLETKYKGSNPAAPDTASGVAVSHDAEAAGRGRFIDDFLNAQSKLTGISFKSEMNPTPSRVIVVLDQALQAGLRVPIVVGPKAGMHAHYVLVTGRRVTTAGTAEYRFFDPATGRTTWISAADVMSGNLDLGKHKVVTGMEVPSTSTSSDMSVDEAAADTERDPAMDRGPDTEPMVPGSAAVESDSQLEAAAVERAKALLATMSGDPRPGKCRDASLKIATQLLAKAGVVTQLFGTAMHYHLRIGDTVVDGAMYQFFNVPSDLEPPIFVGSLADLRAELASLESKFGINTSLVGDITLDQLLDSRWVSMSPNGMVLDVSVAKSGRAMGEFKSVKAGNTGRDAAQVATDFSVLGRVTSLDPAVGFGEQQRALAEEALLGLSDADYLKLRSLVNVQPSDVARAILLDALAAGSPLAAIERMVGPMHGKSDSELLADLAAKDAAPMVPGSAGTSNVDAVLNGAGAMTARVRQMLGRMSAQGQVALEGIAGHALGEGARILGLVDWVQHTAKHTRKLVGDELARRMGDAESELKTVERLLAESPDSTIFMGGDRSAESGASGKKKSSDLRVMGADGSETRVEVTRMATPLAAVSQIDKPFTHGLKEDNLPPGTRREVAIEAALDPAAPASLLDDLAAHLATIPDNHKLDRMTLVDVNGSVLADYVRDQSGWTRVAVATASANAPGAAAGVLPLFDLRKNFPFLLTAGEKAFVAVEAQLDASGRRSRDPEVIVNHENVLLDVRTLTLDEARQHMRQLADGNSHGLRELGINLTFDFDSKQTEWGLAALKSGGYGIIRGDARSVGPRGMPDVLALIAHSHPLTAGREITQPTHVEDILSGQMQYLLHPSGRDGDVRLARPQNSHTIYMPYQYLGNGMIGQTTDNAPNQPFNGLDILRPPGIEVVMTSGPRIIGVHHADADGNPLPVYLVSIQIRAGDQIVYENDFGLFTNSQSGFERLTALDRMPRMFGNAAAEHGRNMQAQGLGPQVGPLDAMEVWTAPRNSPLGFAVLDQASAESAFERITAGDASGLTDIGMITDGMTAMPTDIVFALAQRPDGAFVIVRGGKDGVEVPPGLVEIARAGGAMPAASPAPTPASWSGGSSGTGGGSAGSGWSGGGGSGGSAGAGWQGG